MLAKSLVALFSAIASVSAGGLGTTNWGISSPSLKAQAHSSERTSCSGSGSFFTEYQSRAICCSSQTRQPPSSDLTCPFSWYEHKTAKCCIPQQEVQDCDCGEGYGWQGSNKRCSSNTGGYCGSNQWWHDRSNSCCDNSWEHSPPEGTCDPGKSCPTGWFWHKALKRCKPRHKRSPKPDCDDWDHRNQCCGGHGPQPSPKASRKRGLQTGLQTALFPQTDLDKLYCPFKLHACSVVTNNAAVDGAEWSYECIDFETEIQSCGGCASTGEGQDCTTIPYARSVGCQAGVCTVYSCKTGFRRNGTSCVPF